MATDGAHHGETGYFVAPTLMVNMPDDARIVKEDPFGPITAINPVTSLDDAITRANSVRYGRAGDAFPNRAGYMEPMIDKGEAGTLSINSFEAPMPETPSGGVKSSGFGCRGGSEGLDNSMTIKTMWHASQTL